MYIYICILKHYLHIVISIYVRVYIHTAAYIYVHVKQAMSCIRNSFFEALAAMLQNVVAAVDPNTVMAMAEEKRYLKMSMVQRDLEVCPN